MYRLTFAADGDVDTVDHVLEHRAAAEQSVDPHRDQQTRLDQLVAEFPAGRFDVDLDRGHRCLP